MAAPAGGFRCFLPALLSAVIFLAAAAAAFLGVLPSRVDFRRGVTFQMTFLATMVWMALSPASAVPSASPWVSVGPVAWSDGDVRTSACARRRALKKFALVGFREVCDFPPAKFRLLLASVINSFLFVGKETLSFVHR